jgi:hypothetical protein
MSLPGLLRVRDPQRGNTLLLALIVLSALATLGSLTVVSVQSNLKTSTNDRAQTIAMYAAESGAALAMDFLRSPGQFNASTGWSAYVLPFNPTPPYDDPFVLTSAQIPSVGVPPGPGNPLSPDQNAWYEVKLLNNRDDPGYHPPVPGFTPPASNTDQDGRLIIRAIGHGPQGSLAVIEYDVLRVGLPPAPPLPPPPPPWNPVPASTLGVMLIGWRIVSL